MHSRAALQSGTTYVYLCTLVESNGRFKVRLQGTLREMETSKIVKVPSLLQRNSTLLKLSDLSV